MTPVLVCAMLAAVEPLPSGATSAISPDDAPSALVLIDAHYVEGPNVFDRVALVSDGAGANPAGRVADANAAGLVADTGAAPDDQENDIVVSARPRHVPGDPIQAINIKSFAVTRAVDDAFFGPVALAYQHAIPQPIRSGLRNFLNNVFSPVVFLNDVLQLKPGKAAQTLARFVINTTAGVGGILDVAKAKPFRIARHHDGLANTLGFYGVKPGAFLYVPLIGPTTIRDLIGTIVDRMLLPLTVGRPFNRPGYSIPVGTLSVLDRRAENDEKIHALRDNALDAYSNARQHYLEQRQAEIDALHGKPPATKP